MIIIAREELNQAASGLTEPRREGFAFRRWLATEAPAKHEADAASLDRPTAQPVADLYKNRFWRCE
ncbi:MAG: hypothetical protein HYS17_01650 [Micavibrio aeruginosavorus]|uniref:Uncharacterized protein n=1 Tax=Micavibrio aeruginosavorus TaxID=349221 RepID=A0A7T5R304_9BACT|nr:MAG: hypothetical protein HYS17_01650 [Micavibrio aeruginosavorus]